MEKVKSLNEKLEKEIPNLGIRFGLGADTDKWLKFPPDEKGEPDFTIFYEYEKICYIEVSGSDKVKMKPPQDIWIRPDKYDHALSKDEETWFYMVYPNEVFVLNRKTIEPYKDNITTAYIKKNKHGRPIPEKYIAIPCVKAYPEETLFEWIRERLH